HGLSGAHFPALPDAKDCRPVAGLNPAATQGALPMTREGRKPDWLALCYISIGLLALILTWRHALVYLGDGLIEANLNFWQDALFNSSPAGVFLTVDILFYALAGSIWMVVEARRLGMSAV